ncbi:MAG: hypothetical protein L0Y66_10550 [Myxococcaceae bacterium]|nr:hypothetical protein [Myxococcaceae bacterium]
MLVGSAVLGIAAGTLLPTLQFKAAGRPDPLVTALGMGVGLGVNVAASQLLVPHAAQLGDDAGYAVDVAEARHAGWRLSRWAVLAGGLGVATLAVGAGMERREFGAGQSVMALGASTVVLSGLVYFGLELAGVLHGSQSARRPRHAADALALDSGKRVPGVK